MKADASPDFLREYERRRPYFRKALHEIRKLLALRLAQLSARTGVRGRLTEYRIKRPGKVWKNAARKGSGTSGAFREIEDLIGIRIVCNNLSDIEPLVDMIRNECSLLRVLQTKSTVFSPSPSGYRAMHIRTQTVEHLSRCEFAIPCEIQIRTLAQETWARMSREDLYGKEAPEVISKLAATLSTQLSAIDEIAQLIRDELNRCPAVAENIADSDHVSPARLALLYMGTFQEDLYEWHAIEWIRYLDEAEVDTIGEVRTLLSNSKVRMRLDRMAVEIRGFPLENSEWVIYSALIASDVSSKFGMREVRKRIRNEWNEINAVARREILSAMPETIDDFVSELRMGKVCLDVMKELGGVESCSRCATPIILPERAAISTLEYYGDPEVDEDLEELFQVLPEAESVNVFGVCSYCAHQLQKDD